jgi:hypothetical protein
MRIGREGVNASIQIAVFWPTRVSRILRSSRMRGGSRKPARQKPSSIARLNQGRPIAGFVCKLPPKTEDRDRLNNRAGTDEDCRRLELNAMTSRQVVDFVVAALAANAVEKVVPEADVLEQQARNRLQIKLTSERLAAIADEIAQEAAATALHGDLEAQVRALLDEQPELSWDQALAQIIG